MVVLTRNIDLSVGSIVGLTAYISSNTLADHHGVPIVVIALLAMGVQARARDRNGLLVTVGRSRRSSPRSRRSRSSRPSLRGHGRTEHPRVPAPGRIPRPRREKPLGLPCSRGSRSCRGPRRRLPALVAVGTGLLRDGLEPGRGALRRHPGRPPGDDRLRDQRRARGLGGFMFAARFASVDAVAGQASSSTWSRPWSRERSYGDISTITRSPTPVRMRNLRILPAV